MTNKTTSILFSNVFLKASECDDNKNYQFERVIIKNVEYAIYHADNPFREKNLFGNKSEKYDIQNKNVYDLISGSILNFGYYVFGILYENDNKILKIIENRNKLKYWIDFYKDKENERDKKNEEDKAKMIHLKDTFFENFIVETKKLNKEYYNSVSFEKEFKFIMMPNLDEPNLFKEYLTDYNKQFQTNFKIIELPIFEEVYEFVVLAVSKGNYSDLFYLGFHLAYMDKKRNLELLKGRNNNN